MASQRGQNGIALLEALIAILIFSLGVLGLVALQANSITFLSDTRDRVEASQLAAQLASTLQVTDPAALATLAYPGTGIVPAGLASWVAQVESKMPGAATVRPIIAVTNTTGGLKLSASGNYVNETVTTVAITVRWKPPSGDIRQHRLDLVIPN